MLLKPKRGAPAQHFHDPSVPCPQIPGVDCCATRRENVIVASWSRLLPQQSSLLSETRMAHTVASPDATSEYSVVVLVGVAAPLKLVPQHSMNELSTRMPHPYVVPIAIWARAPTGQSVSHREQAV